MAKAKYDASQLAEMEKVLKNHLVWLEDLLSDPERIEKDNYLPLAGHLRVLLLDSKLPVLAAYILD